MKNYTHILSCISLENYEPFCGNDITRTALKAIVDKYGIDLVVDMLYRDHNKGAFIRFDSKSSEQFYYRCRAEERAKAKEKIKTDLEEFLNENEAYPVI